MGPSRSLNSSYISPSHEIIGQLHELDPSGHVCKQTAIFADEQILVGRDMRICQYPVWDPVISNKHLRIHVILYERATDGGYEALVFAEDLSRNGTFLNGTLMGRGKGAFLLSTGDKLRISPRFEFRFIANPCHEQLVHFDRIQDNEIQVEPYIRITTYPDTHPAFQNSVQSLTSSTRVWGFWSCSYGC